MTKIYVAGHKGLVGSAMTRAIDRLEKSSWVGLPSSSLDLRVRSDVFDFIDDERPDVMIMAAAKVGGILANSNSPVEFLSDNIQIQTNLLDAAHAFGVKKVVFIGSSCVYPKFAPQPITESALLTGGLEHTNEAFAIAKLAGLKLVEAYRREYAKQWISIMPTNIYGPGDNFDLETAHVLPALIHRFHIAKMQGQPRVTVWGSGSPRREFMHADDLADACLFALDNFNGNFAINVGTGTDISIRELTELIKESVGYHGEIVWDEGKPDGTPRKQLDVSEMIKLGWRASIDLEIGLTETYKWFQSEHSVGKK